MESMASESDARTGFGVDSMVGTLRQVAMRRPGAILTANADKWHYAKPINASELLPQYEAFTQLLQTAGVEISWLADDNTDGLADSVFTYDPSFVIPAGAIILRPGKEARRAEVQLHRAFYEGLMPILGTIEPPQNQLGRSLTVQIVHGQNTVTGFMKAAAVG